MNTQISLPRFDARDVTMLRAVQTFWNERGYAPTLRELASALEIKSTSIPKYRVGTLEKRGLLLVPRNDRGVIVAHAMSVTTLGRIVLDQEEPS